MISSSQVEIFPSAFRLAAEELSSYELASVTSMLHSATTNSVSARNLELTR
jgi:hypothetical protein